MNSFNVGPKRYSSLRAVVVVAIAIIYIVFPNMFRDERLKGIEQRLDEKIAKHGEWTSARRNEVKAMEEKAAQADDDQQDKLTEEVEAARQAFDEAIAADRSEILALWNEARKAGSKMPPGRRFQPWRFLFTAIDDFPVNLSWKFASKELTSAATELGGATLHSTLNNEQAFAFRFDDKRQGWQFYRTISLWCKEEKHGRDVRQSHPVLVANLLMALEMIGQSYRWVENKTDLLKSIDHDGWILIPQDFAHSHLAHLLTPCETVKSPLGLFWDVAIPRNRAAQRRVRGDLRDRVLSRDGHKCVECGKAAADGAPLTMDHVIPFSRGGETSEGNLVTLCNSCNDGHGNHHHSHLFALAGLHSGWDPKIIRTVDITTAVDDVITSAIMLSQNILVSSCRPEIFGPVNKVQ